MAEAPIIFKGMDIFTFKSTVYKLQKIKTRATMGYYF